MSRYDEIRDLLASGCSIKKVLELMPTVTYGEVKAVRRDYRCALGIASRPHKNNHDMLSKCAIRAAQLGMSYGAYMGSSQHTQDIAGGYFKPESKKKTVTAATVHGNIE